MKKKVAKSLQNIEHDSVESLLLLDKSVCGDMLDNGSTNGHLVGEPLFSGQSHWYHWYCGGLFLGNLWYHWYSGGLTWAIIGISTNIKTKVKLRNK